MRIGITGSVGYLGANLVHSLLSNPGNGDRIICFYSRRRTNPLTASLEAESRHLDITRLDDTLEKTRDLDLLYHLAGVVDYSRRGAFRTWQVNVVGSRNIFEAVRQNRIGKLVYCSSINVLGTVQSNGPPAAEDNVPYGSPGNPISFSDRDGVLEAVEDSLRGDHGFLKRSRVPYFDSKLAGYELARDYHRRFGLPVAIALPGTAVGAGDVGLSITRLIMRTLQGRLRFTLPGCTSFVAAADAADGLRRVALHGTPGQSYIITGAETDNLSYADFMRRVVAVGKNRYGLTVPERFFTVPAGLCRILAAALRLLPLDGELSEALILSGIASHRFHCRKAGKELGYTPKIPMEDAIASCIDFYED